MAATRTSETRLSDEDVAKVMGLTTVAEFVDKAPVLERLHAMGVDFAQGYLLHEPAPIDELIAPVPAEA